MEYFLKNESSNIVACPKQTVTSLHLKLLLEILIPAGVGSQIWMVGLQKWRIQEALTGEISRNQHGSKNGPLRRKQKDINLMILVFLWKLKPIFPLFCYQLIGHSHHLTNIQVIKVLYLPLESIKLSSFGTILICSRWKSHWKLSVLPLSLLSLKIRCLHHPPSRVTIIPH